MTKPVRDYFARCMEDPEFAAAYRELEAEYQAECARIQARIQRDSLRQMVEAEPVPDQPVSPVASPQR
jgi:hypothetical protein